MLKGRKVIIVGGAGFIGHHLAIRLKNLGAGVTIIDNLMVNNYYHYLDNRHMPQAELYIGFTRERIDLLKEHEVDLVEVDAREYHDMCSVINETAGDVLIHLAAVAHADKSNRDPFSTFDHSLRTLENSLDISRSPNNDVNHFIYFSSSMVYGDFVKEPITEDAVCDPIGIYGALKYCGERMVRAYNQVFGLPFTIVRPSALYGERCVSRRVGQVFIENALGGRDVVVKGDGSDRLDFTYIADVVNGVAKMIELERSRNETFNLTYGQGRSLLDVIEIVRQECSGVSIKHEPRNKLMPRRGSLSVEKARRTLGYQPEYPLERGLVQYIRWYESIWRQFLA
jgi:nucleoside-diphosphate-sugar epimerase